MRNKIKLKNPSNLSNPAPCRKDILYQSDGTKNMKDRAGKATWEPLFGVWRRDPIFNFPKYPLRTLQLDVLRIREQPRFSIKWSFLSLFAARYTHQTAFLEEVATCCNVRLRARSRVEPGLSRREHVNEKTSVRVRGCCAQRPRRGGRPGRMTL